MGRVITRKEVEFDQCFPDDIEQYYDIATKYLNIGTEDFATAFETSKEAWVLADRWANIAANAGKLAKIHDVNKTALSDYCYRKYRQMQYIHEHCRSIWKSGEERYGKEPGR